MTVNRIESSPISFGNFYTNGKGAYNLASELFERPALEQKFMENLVEPLSHTKIYDVFVSGDVVTIVNKQSEALMSILQPGSVSERSLGLVYDYKLCCRNNLRQDSHVIPTENFSKDGYLLSSIETAKNIIFDREAIASQKAVEKYSRISAESIQEKSDRFEDTFKNHNLRFSI